MEYSIISEPPEKLQTDCIVVGAFKQGKLSASAAALDKATKGLIKKLLARDEFEGKVGDLLLISHTQGIGPQRIAVVGLGDGDTVTRPEYRKALSVSLRYVRDSKSTECVVALADCSVRGADLAWQARQIGEIAGTVCYRYVATKKNGEAKDHPPRLGKVQLHVATEHADAARLGLLEGQVLANAMNLVRDLANLPGNICTPAYLAEQAEMLGKTNKKLKVKILDENDLADLGMGSFLSVAKGSRQPPRMIVMEYKAAGKAKPIVLIGKGLTFDAGGISIKPAASMDEMKYDMCGGASVIGAMQAVSELKLPLNVVGLVPASENLPDGNANKPGDIVTSMAGITIEILNTDAEGRLLLCDALHYAKRFSPAVVIDMATLTGACIVALGRHPSGLMGNDDGLCNALIEAGEQSCDRAWRLPIWDDYQEQLKSNFADLANIGGPDGGTITAACFLSRFAKDFKWAHLDIAGTAWKTGADKGATGRPVPLLLQYLLNQAQQSA